MKKPKAPKLVTIAITTTITVIFWIFFTLYQVLTNKPSPSVEPQLLDPIDPTLDTITLNKLNDKGYYEEGSFTPIKLIQPSQSQDIPEIIQEEPSPVPIASDESQINQ